MLILLGKPCSGKSTIQKELLNIGMQPILEYTTRPMRDREINGKSYYFISKNDFAVLEKNGFFATTNSYRVITGDVWDYGIAVNDLKDGKMIVTNPASFENLQKFESIHPVSFYIKADDDVILNRITKRGDNIDEIKRRLNADFEDLKNAEKNADFVFTNNGRVKPFILANVIKYIYKKYINYLTEGFYL